MKLKNIKLRFIFKKDILVQPKKQLIWRDGKSTFSIYKDATKFINVTGLKSLQEKYCICAGKIDDTTPLSL